MDYLIRKAKKLEKEWKDGIKGLVDSLNELADHYQKMAEIEYCTHIHTSSCQHSTDCPCSYEHECKNGIITQECQTCGGEGRIPKYEQVWSGEPHMADIGSQPCPNCQREDDSDMSGAE